MNHNNINSLKISRHAIDRFFERLVNQELPAGASLDEKLNYANTAIKELFKESFYLKDVDGSIYFRAYEYKVDLVIKHQTVITILAINDAKSRREKKRAKTEAENTE